MLVSRKWLQEYFKDKLPSGKEIAEILTMRAFEIESVEEKGGDEIIDVKVLPNRAHDCLCHRGIAREIAAILDKKFVEREVSRSVLDSEEKEQKLEVKIGDNKLCPRYMGKSIENIKIKPSPDWLREKLESLGERSICNIVDITNYVMLDMGQPMHAFDADKVEGNIQVRLAKSGERITLLTGEEVELDETMLVIADDVAPLAIAGIKGGKKAEVLPETKNIILESANFNTTSMRKTAQKVNIKNNASKRYENEISPELAKPAMDYATALISQEGQPLTKFYKTVDAYPRRRNPYKVGISLSELNRLLGAEIKEKDAEDILNRTGWEWEKVKVEDALRAHLEEARGKEYKNPSSMQFDAPNYFSCSSLVSYLYTQAGVWMPSISIDKYVFGKPVEKNGLKFGDLVFSNTGNGAIRTETVEFAPGTQVPEGVDHVGMYLGDGQVLHATKRAGKVVVEDLKDNDAFGKIVGFRRVADIDEERFVVTAPFERLDLRIKEDLVEEIGRIYGYEKIEPKIPEIKSAGEGQVPKDLEMAQKLRKVLAEQGYSEVYTYAFSKKGEVECENPIASDKAFLRSDLSDGLKEALEMNWRNAPFLGLQEIKIFEIGTVFHKDNEEMRVAWGTKNKKEAKVEEYNLEKGLEKLPAPSSQLSADIFDLPQRPDAKFKPISPYPFVLRDIAVWTPAGTEECEVLKIILENSGDLLVRHGLFDRFEKEDKVSYAFNLVFQSQEKTLTDAEINSIMEKITAALNAQNGWQVR